MEIETLVGALVIGVVVGALGRLVVPGRQPIGCIFTILIGIVGALIGSWLGTRLGTGIWLTLALQVLVAAVLVALAAGGMRRRV